MPSRAAPTLWVLREVGERAEAAKALPQDAPPPLPRLVAGNQQLADGLGVFHDAIGPASQRSDRQAGCRQQQQVIKEDASTENGATDEDLVARGPTGSVSLRH